MILFISQKLLQKIASSMLETISVANYTDITIIVFSTLIYIYKKKNYTHQDSASMILKRKTKLNI